MIFAITVVIATVVVLVTTELGFRTLSKNSISAVMKGDVDL